MKTSYPFHSRLWLTAPPQQLLKPSNSTDLPAPVELQQFSAVVDVNEVDKLEVEIIVYTVFQMQEMSYSNK